MYSVNHNKVSNVLEVESPNKKLYAKIYLDEGASLQELTLSGQAIIQDLSPLTYANTYASSILFPFANRVKGGVYTFEGDTYQLEANQREEHNALHGLVYNKTFSVVDGQVDVNSATLILEYNETNASVGFPYTYHIQLKYVFSQEGLSLGVIVKNTSSKAFPFTLGWHPYFCSDNLYESEIQMDSSQKIVLGEGNITKGVEKTNTESPLKIKDQQLDDCWILNSDEVVFKTPKYHLQFNATGDNNYLQLYTPPKTNTIAIEPTTGVSDSLNNKIGLQILQPNEAHNMEWRLKIKEDH
ncbi:aldose 1-epimerase [Aestuariivivens insulae]|uniref:aldose 1-epimerase n=1 Tax=Aestuariivivens insulae TaxID=1621988 RepID=UPI001F5874C8|nr:aldose 1-epimerase [Aestuariivivens insulae]